MSKGLTGIICSWACVIAIFAATAEAQTSRTSGRRARTTATATSPATAPASSASTASAASKPASKPALKGIALIRLSGEIVEAPPDFSLFDGAVDYMTLRDWVQRLAKARNDDSVKAVALDIRSPRLNWAQAQELSDAVKRLNAVKPVYVYVTSPSSSDYLVASAAKDISMEAAGEIGLVGLGIEMTYFRGTMDKLGIKPQMIQIGKFKGASEPMMNTEPSQEVKDNFEWLLNDMYDQMCSQLAANRKLDIDAAKAAIDAGPLSGKDAVEYKLVDRLAERLDWQDEILKQMKLKESDVDWLVNYGKKTRTGPDLSNPFAMLNMIVKGSPAPQPKDPTIAIISAEGVIVSGAGGESFMGGKQIGAKTIIEAFESVRKDKRVKAIVFRINSPGGSALASEQIYQAVHKCQAQKPVVVSISGMGASGGYYISLGGGTIIADPAGIIGSIGVISGKIALTGTKEDGKKDSLMDKIGVTTYEMTRGKNAGLFMSRPWDEREMAVMQRQAQNIYNLFVQRVSESRTDKIKKGEDVAQGRVFSARQAAANGMIDRVGGIRDAMLAAQKAANLGDDYYIINLPRPKTLADLFGASASADDDDETLSPLGLQTGAERLAFGRLARTLHAGPSLAYLLDLAELMDRESVLAAMPYYFTVRR